MQMSFDLIVQQNAQNQNGTGSRGKSLDDNSLAASNHTAESNSNCNSSSDLLKLASEKRNSYNNSRQSSAETGSIKFNNNRTDVENTAL